MSDDETPTPDADESGSIDVSPEQAAQAATAESPDDMPDMGDMDLSDAGESTPWYKQTEPNPPIEEVEPVDQWQEYYLEYFVRGTQKAAGASDAWAAMDLFRGAVGLGLHLVDEFDL